MRGWLLNRLGGPDDIAYATTATSISGAHDQKRKLDAFAEPPPELIQNFWDDHLDPNTVPMSPTQLLSIFSATQNEPLGSTLEGIKPPAPAPSTTTTHYTFPSPFQPKIMYPQLDNSQPTAEIRTYAPGRLGT